MHSGNIDRKQTGDLMFDLFFLLFISYSIIFKQVYIVFLFTRLLYGLVDMIDKYFLTALILYSLKPYLRRRFCTFLRRVNSFICHFAHCTRRFAVAVILSWRDCQGVALQMMHRFTVAGAMVKPGRFIAQHETLTNISRLFTPFLLHPWCFQSYFILAKHLSCIIIQMLTKI